MRLIDANEVSKELKDMARRAKSCGEYAMSLGIDIARDVVDEAPTVDPVKHGRWIDHQYKEFPIGRYECSVCGARHDMPWDFCPNCGAYMMDGDEE